MHCEQAGEVGCGSFCSSRCQHVLCLYLRNLFFYTGRMEARTHGSFSIANIIEWGLATGVDQLVTSLRPCPKCRQTHDAFALCPSIAQTCKLFQTRAAGVSCARSTVQCIGLAAVVGYAVVAANPRSYAAARARCSRMKYMYSRYTTRITQACCLRSSTVVHQGEPRSFFAGTFFMTVYGRCADHA